MVREMSVFLYAAKISARVGLRSLGRLVKGQVVVVVIVVVVVVVVVVP